MKKIAVILSIFIIAGCKSVDNWEERPVLGLESIKLAESYVEKENRYQELIEQRRVLDVDDELTVEQLNELLIIEKEIALTSKAVANSWFDFYLELRQDIGFKKAYAGHYYFRKGIDALNYVDKMSSLKSNLTVKESKNSIRINELTTYCRLAVAELTAYNTTLYEPDLDYKELKSIYKSMN